MSTATLQLTLLKYGLATSLRDHGRPGRRAWGVPLGGPLDRRSALLANWLVGRPAGSPVLEMTLLPPKIQLIGNGLIALTGADFQWQLNGQPIDRYATIEIRGGGLLSGRPTPPAQPCRSYLAIRGEWNLPHLLGSREAPPGQPANLSSGTKFNLETDLAFHPRSLHPEEWVSLPPKAIIRVYPAPEWSVAPPSFHRAFLTTTYTVLAQSNRMGLRLSASNLPPWSAPPQLVSSPVLPGTIQFPPSGQPIALLADGQTIGGYPRLLQVAEEDLDILGQLGPGSKLRFSLVK